MAASRGAPAAKYPTRERRRGEREKKPTYSEINTPPPPPSSRTDLRGRKQFQLRVAALLQVLMEMNVGGVGGVGGSELCRVMAHIPHMLLSGSAASEEPPLH